MHLTQKNDHLKQRSVKPTNLPENTLLKSDTTNGFFLSITTWGLEGKLRGATGRCDGENVGPPDTLLSVRFPETGPPAQTPQLLLLLAGWLTSARDPDSGCTAWTTLPTSLPVLPIIPYLAQNEPPATTMMASIKGISWVIYFETSW